MNNFSMFKVLYFYFLTSRKGALTKTVVPDLIEVRQQVAMLPDTGEIGRNIWFIWVNWVISYKWIKSYIFSFCPACVPLSGTISLEWGLHWSLKNFRKSLFHPGFRKNVVLITITLYVKIEWSLKTINKWHTNKQPDMINENYNKYFVLWPTEKDIS